VEIVEELLRANAKTLVKNSNHLRPVDLAQRKRFFNVVGMILECETDRRINKAKHLTKLEADAHDVFKIYDADGSGTIERDELEKCVTDLMEHLEREAPSQEDLDDLMMDLADPHSNTISKESFIDWWVRFNADDATLQTDAMEEITGPSVAKGGQGEHQRWWKLTCSCSRRVCQRRLHCP
jgi:hypothetical protein